jgi:hypothetical protein
MGSEQVCPVCAAAPSSGAGGCVQCLAGLFAPNLADELPELPGLVVLRFVGRGGFGAVYEACDPTHGRVAVKVLHPERPGADPGRTRAARDRFRREFDAVRRLHHPGIIGVHEFGEDGERVWFTMDFLDGGSLAEAFAERPPVPVAVGYARALAEILTYAHDRGVCHLDLTPSNVMLDAAGRPVVVDFGLAAGIADGRPVLREEVRGYTLRYTAPECRSAIDGGANPVQADVYSFGAVLAHALAGAPTANGPPALPREVPADLRAVCEKCLEADPRKRYARMAEVLADLDAFLAGRPVSARALSPPARAWRAVRRNPGRSALAALLVGALLLAGVQWRVRAAERAREERDRENREAAVIARAGAEAVAHLAELAEEALRTGRWDTAAERYAEAIPRHPQPDRLMLRRLQSLFAGGRMGAFQTELAALEGDPGMAAHRGQLLLLRAELEFLDPQRTDAGRDLTRRALAESLSGADADYARGLLADSTAEMLDRFEAVAIREPSHYRSQAALAVGLLVTGRYPEARARVRYMRGLFPDDLLPDFVEGMADLYDGRTTDGLILLDRVADQLRGRGGLLRAHVRTLAQQFDAVRKMNARAGMGPALTLTQLADRNKLAAAMTAPLARAYGPDHLPLALPSPVVSRLFEPGLGYARAAQTLLIKGDARAACAIADAALAKDPDASLASFASGVRFVIAKDLVASDKPEDRAKLEAALRRIVELGELAVVCPSRFPGGSFRYEGRSYAVVALACLSQENEFPAAAKEFRPRLLAALPRLVAEGAAFPVMRRDMIRTLVNSKLLDGYASRAILAEWAAAAAEPEAWELLVQVELAAGNRPAARDAADRASATFMTNEPLKARLDKLLRPARPIPEAKP